MTRQLITVGHSPDPDDAFMFYALAHDKIDTGDLEFRHELQDIETLNRRALRGELEVTAVSIHAYAQLLGTYALLPSGCSMGDRYGPMVVSHRPMGLDELARVQIAVPGTMTTAYLALRLLLHDLSDQRLDMLRVRFLRLLRLGRKRRSQDDAGHRQRACCLTQECPPRNPEGRKQGM